MTELTNRIHRHGFYTVEAAIILPLLILAVLTVGYFIRMNTIWENVMNSALDECSYSAATESSGILGKAAKKRISERITRDAPGLSALEITGSWQTVHLSCAVDTSLPLGFGRSYCFGGRIKYRDFKGLKYDATPLGTEGLETNQLSRPVWIFPQSGTKYHEENCTYVKATVHSCVLTQAIKKKHPACELCQSGTLSPGSIVFCFNGEGTAYHRGRCRSIKRHTMVIDRTEAEEKGYSPCSKCGGRMKITGTPDNMIGD